MKAIVPDTTAPEELRSIASGNAPKRIVLWIDEMNDAFVEALRTEGVELAALVQAKHPDVPSFSVYDLYYGSPALEAFPDVAAPAGWIDDSSFREYARCVQRMGFYPASPFMETFSGGVMAPSDFEDWARVHLQNALRLLEGVAADEVWFSFNPHLGIDNMLALAAQRTHRKCLVFSQIRFAPKFAWRQLGVPIEATHHQNLQWKEWDGGATQPNLFYMRENDSAPWHHDLGKRLGSMARRLLQADWSALSSRLYTGARRRRWWSLMGLLELLDARTRPWAGTRWVFRRRFDEANSLRTQHALDGDFKGNIVYFPLHLEPEENVQAMGGDYRNQLDAIVALHTSLPTGWTLVLKENPKQSFQYRGAPFAMRLAQLPHVRFVHPDVPSSKMIESARVVAGITGTAGYEGLLIGKPCLYFGDAWYAGLPGATRFSAGIDLEALASQRVSKPDLDAGVNQLLSNLADGLAHPRFAGIYRDTHDVETLYRDAARSMSRISSVLPGLEEVVLRRAEAADSLHVYRIKKDTATAQRKRDEPWADAEEWPQHERRFASQDYWFIEFSGMHAGIMATTVRATELRLNQLFVLPAWQGQGLGRAAMARLLQDASARALPVRLDVAKGNHRAAAFYASMGFVKVGEDGKRGHMERLPRPIRAAGGV